MSKPTLRAVVPGETAPQEPPATLADATQRDRRSLMVRSRLEVARTIDGGVPAHALARLISELDRIDSEIRRLDALALQAGGEERNGRADDDTFDASAI